MDDASPGAIGLLEAAAGELISTHDAELDEIAERVTLFDPLPLDQPGK